LTTGERSKATEAITSSVFAGYVCHGRRAGKRQRARGRRVPSSPSTADAAAARRASRSHICGGNADPMRADRDVPVRRSRVRPVDMKRYESLDGDAKLRVTGGLRQIARLERPQYLFEMLSVHRARVTAFVAASGLLAAACANEEQHAPFASATCRTQACSPEGTISGGSAPRGETDSGPSSEDSGTASRDIVCHTDPTSLIELCSGSMACPGLFLDPVAFASCGFRGPGVDVECICNGNSLCPVAVQTNCSYVGTQ